MKAAVDRVHRQNRSDDRLGGKPSSASPGQREVILNNPDRSTSGRDNPEDLPGVIFDMDGVLVRSEPLIAEAAIRMFAEKGVAVRPRRVPAVHRHGRGSVPGRRGRGRGVAARPASRQGSNICDLSRADQGPARATCPGSRDSSVGCRAAGLRLAVASSADAMKVEGNLRRDRPSLRRPSTPWSTAPRRRPQEARPRHLPGGLPPARSGAGGLPGDRGRRLGRRGRPGRRLPLPGRHHLVPRRKARRRRRRLDSWNLASAPDEVLDW